MRMRNVHVLLVAALSIAAVAIGWSPQARSQINAAPSWVPIGVSASGSGSTVWFHEPSTRQTVACQLVAGAGAGAASIHCVSTKLP